MDIGPREKMYLSLGGFGGITLVYYVSHSWFLSLLMGSVCGVGGATIALLVLRGIVGTEVFRRNRLHGLGKKQKIGKAVNLGAAVTAVAILSYIRDDKFEQTILLLMIFSIVCFFIYDWFEEEPRKDGELPT